MSLQTLPLSKLLLSDLNVRRTERDADIASLAEDIAASGLLKNLVVIPAHFTTSRVSDDEQGTDRWADKFEVVAGGRRYQALRLLADAGRIEPDHPVAVLVKDRDVARQVSLSENLHTVAMNPADEFEAFAAIVAQQLRAGGTEAEAVAYTAKRFGATVRHVEGRLRLADLAPEILDALRAGTIGLESAKAYAGTTDHELQLKVYKARLKYGDHNPRFVREELRGKTLPLTSALVTFVELENYRAAGGRVEAEMFMGTDGEERIVDVALLEKLAQTRAEAMIPAQAKAEGFKEGMFAKGIGYNGKCPSLPKGYQRHWGYGSELSKAAKKKAIAVYSVDGEGLGLYHCYTFVPEVKREEAPQRDWEAERAASARERAILHRAARMATGFTSAGTTLEGRAFWPTGTAWPVDDRDADEGFYMVALQIRVPKADVEARLAEAEKLIDAEAAAEATKAAFDAPAQTEEPAQ